MPVYSAQDTLECAVQEVLEEILGQDESIEVTWHLICGTQVSPCTVHEDDEEHPPHYRCDPFWRLNLWIVTGPEEDRKASNLVGSLPYEMCFDGDVEPIVELVRRMWSEFQFGSILVEEDLDAHLNQVANEVEKGS